MIKLGIDAIKGLGTDVKRLTLTEIWRAVILVNILHFLIRLW